MNFYKILNKEETHYGLKYHDGLNVDPLPFNPSGNCEPGGIYFSREDILAFLNFDSVWIRQVTLPEGEPVYEIPGSPKKWKAKRVILGPRRRINFQVIKQLVEDGANIHTFDDWPLSWAADRGRLDIVEFLVEKGANIHAGTDYALRIAARNGYLDIVKFLVSKGADVHVANNYALILAAANGHLSTVKFLVSKGADIYAENNYALVIAATNGYLDVVKFLVEKGMDVHAHNDGALRWAAKNGHVDVVKFLETYNNN